MKKIIILSFILYLTVPLFSQIKNINFFIQKAQKNSPILYQQGHQSKIINLNLQKIEALLSKPQISANANILFSPILTNDNNQSRFLPASEGATNYYGYDLAYSDGGQYQATVSISQALFKQNKLSAYRKQAEIEQEKNNNKINLINKKLIFSVQYQYLRCLSAQKKIDYAQKNLKLNAKEIATMQKLVKNGLYQESDLKLLLIQEKNYQELLIKFNASFKTELANLLIFCGISDRSISRLPDFHLEMKKRLLDSTFIKKYKMDSLAIIAENKINNLQYLPNVNAFADAGLNAIYIPSFDRLGISFGLTLSYLIYDGKQRKIEEQISKIKLDNTNFEKNNFLTKNQIRKKNIIHQISALNKELKIKNEQLLEYTKLLIIYKLQLSQGQISMLNYVDFLQHQSNLKQEKIELETQKQIQINIFNYWNE